MAAIPIASAVLLMHNGAGSLPIAAAGSLSAQAGHALSYDGREGPYEEKGGCDKGATADDLALEARHALDYDARRGAWSAKGAGRMADCAYWGQGGPLSREEIERDMLACGGAFLKSVVSVDRRYAAELGLDTKEAFQRLLRANWQHMMVEAGVADAPAGVRWCACYHTDAENSLHVHVVTWAADGRVAGGWHPSARATREQKAILYRDAYSRVRMQRNLEQDYYRMLLPRIAAAEMGDYPDPAVEERLRLKAERAGIEHSPVTRTLDGRGRSEVAARAASVVARLREGSGLKARDWQLQSEARKLVGAIRRDSAPFAAAATRYRSLVEAKADLAGLAASPAGKHAHGREGGRSRAALLHERERFVRREMDDIRRRVRNQVIRSSDPQGRCRDLARRQVDLIRHRLVTESLRPGRLGLSDRDSERLSETYRQAARLVADDARATGPATAACVSEAARIIASSPAAASAVSEAAERVVDASRGEVSPDHARQLASEQLVPRLADAISWRLGRGLVDQVRMRQGAAPPNRETRFTRGMVARAVATGGVSLGLGRTQGAELAGLVEEARRRIGASDVAGARECANRAAAMIASSPAMSSALGASVGGMPQPDRARAAASAERAIAAAIVRHAAGGEQPAPPGRQHEAATMGLTGIVAVIASEIARGRDAGPDGARRPARPSARAARQLSDDVGEARSR